MGVAANRRRAAPWVARDMGDLAGNVVIVTGANSGIGFETAGSLAGAGATVVMACRNPDKARAALDRLHGRGVRGSLELLRLDLADQSQIADAAAEVLERFASIAGLINNAGVMGLPFSRTPDGVETVFGTNHLGHFAFTGRLMARLQETPQSRVVTVSSLSYMVGKIRFDDLDIAEGYNRTKAYSQSKLANLLFSFELQRRLTEAGSDTMSLAAHPGFAATEIVDVIVGRFPRLKDRVVAAGARVIPPSDAARPSLRAATDARARGGEFYGPGRLFGIAGAPVRIDPIRRPIDEDVQRRLWDRSVELTGVDFDLPSA